MAPALLPIQHFADESPTGEIRPRYRRHGRILIAARVPRIVDLRWTESLRQLTGLRELKSKQVLKAAKASSQVKRLVDANIGVASIYVIDLYSHLRDLVRVIVGPKLDRIELDPDTILKQVLAGGSSPDLARRALEWARETAIDRTLVPAVERLLRKAAERTHIGAKSAAADIFDRNLLRSMRDDELRECVTRLSVALADALSPQVQADVLMKHAPMERLTHGQIALEILEVTVDRELVLDHGKKSPFEAVLRSNQKIRAFVEHEQLRELAVRDPSQADSRAVIELQVADIAAGVARTRFESVYGDTQIAAGLLVQQFDRVYLNNRWLRS